MISADMMAWIHRELLVSIAACDHSGAPLVARCLAIEITGGGRQARLFLNGASAPVLMAHVQAGHWLAVAMEQPRTHRSLQIKGKVLAITPMTDTDVAYCAAYQQSFSEGVVEFGFSAAFSAVFIPPPDASATVIQLAIEQLFEQSPGALAGQSLEQRP